MSEAASPATRASRHAAPRLANILQVVDEGGLPPGEAARLYAELPRWDLAIVDVEALRTFRAELGPDGRLRRANPDLVVLAYFSAMDVPTDWSHQSSPTLFRQYAESLRPEWILRDVAGEPVRFFEPRPGSWHRAADLTTAVKERLVGFLAEHVARSGLVDGIFLDRLMTDVGWLARGAPVAPRDSAWVEGVKDMLAAARAAFPPGFLLAGNAGWHIDPTFAPQLNGVLFEQFLFSPDVSWTKVMRSYVAHAATGVAPRTTILMATSDEPLDHRHLRFALASALMADGYFCASNVQGPRHGYAAYARSYWLAEYAVGRKGWLGAALGEAVAADPAALPLTAALAGPSAEDRVWLRRYEHGVVLVNPSPASRVVHLAAPHRQVDGSSVTRVTLEPRSGIVLVAEAEACRKDGACVVVS